MNITFYSLCESVSNKKKRTNGFVSNRNQTIGDIDIDIDIHLRCTYYTMQHVAVSVITIWNQRIEISMNDLNERIEWLVWFRLASRYENRVNEHIYRYVFIYEMRILYRRDVRCTTLISQSPCVICSMKWWIISTFSYHFIFIFVEFIYNIITNLSTFRRYILIIRFSFHFYIHSNYKCSSNAIQNTHYIFLFEYFIINFIIKLKL